MILYHGTTFEKGKKILEEKVIKSHIKRNYINYSQDMSNTTDGYVYLTKNIHTAYYYGNINTFGENNDKKKYVMIFKLDINENILLPDYDETKVINKVEANLSVNDSLEMCGCVRIANDIKLNNCKVIILPSTNNYYEDEDDVELCGELSRRQLDNPRIEIEENELLGQIFKKWMWKDI